MIIGVNQSVSSRAALVRPFFFVADLIQTFLSATKDRSVIERRSPWRDRLSRQDNDQRRSQWCAFFCRCYYYRTLFLSQRERERENYICYITRSEYNRFPLCSVLCKKSALQDCVSTINSSSSYYRQVIAATVTQSHVIHCETVTRFSNGINRCTRYAIINQPMIILPAHDRRASIGGKDDSPSD